MKKFPQKSLVLLVCVALLLTFTVSGTVAFLADNSGPVENVFTPPTVDTEIDEEFTNNVKSRIAVKNNGNISMYVRVVLIANWVKTENGKEVIVEPAKLSELGFALNTADWTETDGYYYYNEPVEAGKTTDNLLTSDGIKAAVRADGSYLVVTVVHQAIQAAGWPDGVDTAQEAFAKAAE